MDRINKFINDLLSQRGLTNDDRKDLKIELLDHILLLKQHYLDNGYTEDESIELAINNFGDANKIGNSIKHNLPSHNKYSKFSKLELLKTILFMLVGYFIIIFYTSSLGYINYESFFYNTIISFIPIIIGFAYINLKLNTKIIRVKNLLISLAIFFLLEKVLMLLIYILGYHSYLTRSINISNLLDFKYIVIFFILGIFFVTITYFLSDKFLLRFTNHYNSNISNNLLWVLSIALMLLYYLFPNKWYLLRTLVETILGTEIFKLNKNILFLFINNRIIIPNVGLIIFIVMLILLFKQIHKKGIKSLF